MFYYKIYVTMTKGLCVLGNIKATALPLLWGSLLAGLWFLHMLAMLKHLCCCFNLYFILRFQLGNQQHNSSGSSSSKGNIFCLSGEFWAGTEEVTHPHLQPRDLWRFISHLLLLQTNIFFRYFEIKGTDQSNT